MNRKRDLVILCHGKQPSGRIDPGACAFGLTEHNEIRNLINEMKKYSTNIDYITEYDVYARGNIATISRVYKSVTEIHLNAFNGNAHGTEVLISSRYNPDSQDQAIHSVGVKYFFNRGIKKRSDLANMNRMIGTGVSYRLVEVCFIDNKNDIDKFKRNLTQIAKDYVAAIEGKKIEAPKKEEPAVKKPEYDPETLEGHWVKEEWDFLDKVFKENGQKTFSEKRPDDAISRAEVATLLVRMYNTCMNEIKKNR